MSTYLRKCVSLGPSGMMNPVLSEQDYRYNRTYFTETGTKWVRMWAHWPSLQPNAGVPPGQPAGSTANQLLLNLDDQILKANQDGVLVILTLWGFPSWTNVAGRTRFGPAYRTKADGTDKGDNFCFPDALDVASPWGQWVTFLLGRYQLQSATPHVQALEIINEPNNQCWPQQNENGDRVAACYVAQMFQTASVLNAYGGRRVFLMGPATLDLTGNSPSRSDFLDFTEQLLTIGQSYNFVGDPSFFWTHHPYAETTFAPPAPLPTSKLRDKLAGRWSGYGGDTSHPYVFCTETGVQRHVITVTDAQHNSLLQTQIDRFRNDTLTYGRDIGMITNYLFYTTTGFDTGLRNTIASGGTPRTPYNQAWSAASFPGLY